MRDKLLFWYSFNEIKEVLSIRHIIASVLIIVGIIIFISCFALAFIFSNGSLILMSMFGPIICGIGFGIYDF